MIFEEGFLNSSFSRSINSVKMKVYDMKSLQQEEVKERLLINNSNYNKNLSDLKSMKSFTSNLQGNIDGIGLCYVRVSSFFVNLDYTIAGEVGKENEKISFTSNKA